MTEEPPLLEAEGVGKQYGAITALRDVSMSVVRGQVTCLLGDNGAGKSTLIQILSGACAPDSGVIRTEGQEVSFRSSADALDRGIATVYQDLAIVPIMPIFRNFCLGREPVRGWGPTRRFDKRRARLMAQTELESIGIEIADMARAVGTLSGGQRQAVAIARAAYFGARVLILDEPTSSLGVKEAEIVLKYVEKSKAQGVGIVLVTHNVQHAFPVGDTFTILRRGEVVGSYKKGDLSLEELTRFMAGGEAVPGLGGRGTLPETWS